MKKMVCMIGEGAWGTAVATLLANNGYQVKLWCHDAIVADSITKTGFNQRYLPNIKLDPKIEPMIELKQAMSNVSLIFEAIPVKFLRSVVQQAREYVTEEQTWLVLSKGIEKDTLLLPTQIIEDILGEETKTAVFAGPSFAQAVAAKEVTAVTLAAPDCKLGYELQKVLANDYFRPYVSTDMIGVQIGAALKNVITLGIGLLDGAGYSDNTKAFLFTRGLQEMVQLCVAMGGRQETIYGLSGVGDLVLTSMGKLSKNLYVGRQLGAGLARRSFMRRRGESLDAILEKTGYIPEGINTVQSARQLMRKYNVHVPICCGIYEIIFERRKIQNMLQELMSRPLEWECH